MGRPAGSRPPEGCDGEPGRTGRRAVQALGGALQGGGGRGPLCRLRLGAGLSVEGGARQDGRLFPPKLFGSVTLLTEHGDKHDCNVV